MGEYILGTIKGVTLGGLGVWAALDWAVLLINFLLQDKYIDTFGMEATFTGGKKGRQWAFVIGLVGLVLHARAGHGANNKYRSAARAKPSKLLPDEYCIIKGDEPGPKQAAE